LFYYLEKETILMNCWKFVVVSLIIGIFFGTFISCGPPAKGSNPDSAEFETIRQAADAYMNSGKQLNFTGQELYDRIMADVGLTGFQIEWYDPSYFTKGPVIIDVRSSGSDMPDPYPIGHVPSAVNIPWREMAEWKNIKGLPKDRLIVVYSDTGQVSSQVAAILNVLGYDAVNLMWGMTSWTRDSYCAPGRYDKLRDTAWSGRGSYPTNSSVIEPTDIYAFPMVENTDSKDDFNVVMEAANAYLNSNKLPNIQASELSYIMHYGEIPIPRPFFDDPNPVENPYIVPFILDVRDEETYSQGQISGCLHIVWKDLFKKENLSLLPPDRQILVYSETGQIGGQVTALLNMLGYDAINLKWGISSWFLSLPGKDVAPGRYVESRDCIDAFVVEGYEASEPCPV
jgi:rhodanese-related sulfurtransferase